MTIGENIRTKRKQKGMTLEELSPSSPPNTKPLLSMEYALNSGFFVF